MSSPAVLAASRRRFRGAGRPWVPYAFVAPFVILFLTFLVAPIVVALINALFSQKSSGLGFGGTETLFVGFDNFARAFSDTDFLVSFGRVALFGIVQVPVMMLFALTLAMLFDTAFVRAGKFFQFAVFLPYAVPGVIAALLWGFLYQPSVSPLIQGLTAIGIDINLLAPGTVLWSIANISVWSYTGINMIILFAALQSVPREMYEAAKLDGANDMRISVSIKLPMIAPAVLLTTLSSIIGTLQLFNEPKVLQTVSSNISSDYTPTMAIYAASTLGKDANLASAMAVILGLATLIVSIIVLRVSNRTTRTATDGI
ncbi:multiple sugar transport system permease protein [Microbacterium halimionae]|uniref:Multiple sugar transport system permease protein n=1 Tax=Microbacterium halimionae TaxID=1526413 RepID=A0A7W3PMQ6_9MICO|nr:sugar ABC transporter permease [Microbacterium halimionae]MBA8817169.1 multiple sugar transport system permease protein [Microbacterium halimionae]NII94619.1 multiple sugar transport system permease protein [Microbacterium halimionae]